MNQKEKSQPGPVALNWQWLGNTCGCRNIANAARGEVMLGRGGFGNNKIGK